MPVTSNRQSIPSGLTDGSRGARHITPLLIWGGFMGEHDTAYKFLFSHRALMRDLLLGFMEGDWVRELDLDSLEKVSDGYATGDLLSRHNDAL